MESFCSGKFRTWLAGAFAVAIASVSVPANAQVTANEATRISEQQRVIHVLDLLLARLERSQQEGNCNLFGHDRAFLDSVNLSGADVALFVTPEWVEQFQERFGRAKAIGCTPRDTGPATSSPAAEQVWIPGPPLPQVRSKEPDWDFDLYQQFRERVEGLRVLRAAGECEGAQGYNAGLERLGTDLDRTFGEVRNADPEQFRTGRPVLAYFDNWREAATVLGCTQASVAPPSTVPTSPPAPQPQPLPPAPQADAPIARGPSPATAPPPAPTPAAATLSPRFVGAYQSNQGPVTFTQTGGTKGVQNNPFEFHRVDGDTVEIRLTNAGGLEPCPDGRYRSRFRATFTATGFTGAWGVCDDEPTVPWNGTRLTAASDAAAMAPRSPEPAPPVARQPLPEYRVQWGETVDGIGLSSSLDNPDSAIIAICPPTDERERQFYREKYGPDTGTGLLPLGTYGAVFGGPRYAFESDICHAGVHAGAITWTGGRVQVNHAGYVETAIPGVVRNRVSSRTVVEGAANNTYRISKPID